MPVEIEAKIKIKDVAGLRAKIAAVGGTCRGVTLESNTFLDTKDYTLRTRDQGLRLRVNHHIDSGRQSVVITHKGPSLHGVFKTREENELTVADADAAMRLFEGLGFVRVLTFEKRREAWDLMGTEIDIDEVPYLGMFVEIEGPSEADVLKVREALGLAEQPQIKSSYIALLTAHLQEEGVTDRVIGFPK